MSIEDFTMYGGAFGNKQDSVFPNLEVKPYLYVFSTSVVLNSLLPVPGKLERKVFNHSVLLCYPRGCLNYVLSLLCHRGLWCPHPPLWCYLRCPGLSPMQWLASSRTNWTPPLCTWTLRRSASWDSMHPRLPCWCSACPMASGRYSYQWYMIRERKHISMGVSGNTHSFHLTIDTSRLWLSKEEKC